MRGLDKKLLDFIKKEKMVFFLILLFSFLIRIFKLNEIPAELWGDVNEHIIYAKNILKSNFYWGFFGGDGPLFDYLVALFFLFFGKNFLIIKISTVFVGILVIYFAYLIAKKINNNNKLTIYLVPFLMSTSFWLISFSRQAKPYILVLLFVELFIYSYLNKRFFLSGLILGLGLFVQSSFWGMTIFSLLHWKIFLPFLPFFILIFRNQIYPDILLSESSYLGEKIGHNLSFLDKTKNFFGNVFDNFQSIFLKGDIVFRHNIPGRPILDIVSSIFFIIGLIFFFKETLTNKKKLKINLFLFLVFICSQFSSFLDIANSQNSPSFGRMIGAAFFIYYLCSLGMFYFYKKISFVLKDSFFSKLFLFSLLFFIFFKNFYDYFYIYPENLPNKNIPFGKIITDDIKKELNFDKNKNIIIYGCCWGEWGQPEPKSISNYLEDKVIINYFDFFDQDKLCNFIKNKRETILIYTSNKATIYCLKDHNINFLKNNFYQKIFIN
ncbi:MAG: glycosyltransferase family 39 protein [Candidatus Omnitrophica bacterium]|nr:glycosyltransferase family 39 protein [Candidatus Omnitrophota bacterium]